MIGVPVRGLRARKRPSQTSERERAQNEYWMKSWNRLSVPLPKPS